MTHEKQASDERSTISGGSWRAVAAVVVVALWAYPVAGAGGGGGQTTAAQATGDQLRLSVEHYTAGRYEEAVAAARTAVAEAYNNMAISYLGLRRYEEAIQAAQEAIRLKPDFQLARNNLEWIQDEQKKATGAPAQAATPTTATLLAQSLEHARAERFKECIDTARQAAKLDPKFAPAFTNIGFCAARLQLWDEAIRNTQEAIRLDPTSQLAKNNLAWMEQEKLKQDAAKPR